MKNLSIFNKFIFFLNAVLTFVLLLTFMAPYMTWELFSFLSFLTLIVPYLVLINILFVVYWLIKKKKQFLLSFSIVLLGYFTQSTFFKTSSSNNETEDLDIGILTFNTHGSMGTKWSREPVFAEDITRFIAKEDSDIVCIQEFDYKKVKDFKRYPYKYVNYIFPNQKYVVQSILSKYPIIEKGSLDFPDSRNNAIYADILIKKDTVRVYNLHLQSLRFRAGMIKREEPQRLFKRLNGSLQKQLEQAELVKEHGNNVDYKKIICGDFNNTQFSNVYNSIKGEMNDSFQEKGSGFGNTYNFRFLPFRIDFILMDKEIEITSHKNFNIQLSDHEPVMASFRLKE
ncbi:endonuclease/exonuclease/phosphatase family protein [Maribacter sp. HTCC2170]|uniref:endonuclease/exonuclease/phosphatase family protein n=1 Tax=Maribacter sp. (strain HTCC2170 / KCCM 42371) TaxID=313603 RepID=UPI00059F4566|nr:endonuclease/exonuclease/phosphatase family protein [Maribacter sp. HTCC2170]